MPCLRPDGSLTLAARDVLGAMDEPRPVEEIRELSRQPIYRVRGSLRELQEVGYVRPEDDRWMITEEGRDALARA